MLKKLFKILDLNFSKFSHLKEGKKNNNQSKMIKSIMLAVALVIFVALNASNVEK